MRHPLIATGLLLITCTVVQAAPLHESGTDALPATPLAEGNLHFDLTAATLGPLRRRRCAVVAYGNLTNVLFERLWLVARTANSRAPSTAVKLTALDDFQPSTQRTGTLNLCHGQIERATREAHPHGGSDVLDVALYELPHRKSQGAPLDGVRGARRLSPWLRIPRHLWRGA